MTVTQIPYQSSSQLAAEMVFYDQTDEGKKTYERIQNANDFLTFIRNSSEYRDIQQIIAQLPPKARVLDVGVAYGITSGMMGLSGLDVVALEPSLRLCEGMESFFHKMKLSIPVVCATAETMDKVEGSFDALVFYSSLHHCDDVPHALKNAYQLLKPGGKIFLYEPILKFYRSKEWFYRMLIENPTAVGHYGGNEHIYRYYEYCDFLKSAGFKIMASFPSLNYGVSPRRASWDNYIRYLLKKFYYTSLSKGAHKFSLFQKPLLNLGLLNTVIMGQKLKYENC